MRHPDAKLGARLTGEPRAVGAHADANVRVHRETSIGAKARRNTELPANQ